MSPRRRFARYQPRSLLLQRHAVFQTSLTDNTTPDLPADVFGVIAEFLAGSFAFGTLASLNVISKSIRDETLPVLYETFLMDDDDKLKYHQWKKYGSPRGLKYVKFFISKEKRDPSWPQDGNQYKLLPNLVASIHIPVELTQNGRPRCDVRLYKPITSHTLFSSILRTPVHVDRPDHRCWYEAKEACDRERQRPAITPPERVSWVTQSGGHLLPDGQPWSTGISLGPAYVRSRVETEEGVTTILELLKLSARHDVANHAEFIDEERRANTDRDLQLNCDNQERFEQWHLTAVMSLEAFDMFLLRFAEEVKSHPELLRNRFFIHIKGEMTFSEFLDKADRIRTVFTEHATSISDILPGHMDYGLVRLRGSNLVPDLYNRGLPGVKPEWVCARVLLEVPEAVGDGIRFRADLADCTPNVEGWLDGL